MQLHNFLKKDLAERVRGLGVRGSTMHAAVRWSARSCLHTHLSTSDAGAHKRNSIAYVPRLFCPLQIVACCVSEDAQDKLGGSQRPSYTAGVRDGWESVGGCRGGRGPGVRG